MDFLLAAAVVVAATCIILYKKRMRQGYERKTPCDSNKNKLLSYKNNVRAARLESRLFSVGVCVCVCVKVVVLCVRSPERYSSGLLQWAFVTNTTKN